ncbi:MAG: hypothetical protein IT425_11235 [Pirellulales bacterium]|nr:hypothetical protein [Pirellulales bacterium]
MASPFRVFRKYSKPLMAFFVVVLMVSFLLADAAFNFFGSGRTSGGRDQRGGEVAVRWEGGELTNNQLAELVFRRQMLNAFLTNILGMGEQSAYEAGVEPRPVRLADLRGVDSAKNGVEQSVVMTRIIADAARAAGMSVGDESLGVYLDELGRGNVTREQMRKIVSGLQERGMQISIDFVLAGLREEMLAHNYLVSNQYAFRTVTPEQLWRDWLRVNDRVVVEAAAIPVERFVADVKDPSDAELEKLYEENKEFEPGPRPIMNVELPVARPGFRQMRKIDIQFVEANYDDYLTKAEEKVTEEEIAKYYDEHKEMFVKADTGLMEEKSAVGPGAKGATAPAETNAEGKSADEAAPSNEASEPGKADENKAEPQAAPKQGPEPNPDGKTDLEGKPNAEGKQSGVNNNRSASVFQLASFQEAAGAKEEKKEEGKTAPSGTDQPRGEAPTADSKAAEGAAAPPSDPGTTAGETKPGDTKSPAGDAAAAKKPVEYQPLDEVKDQIRRELASKKVAEELDKLIGEIESELSGEYNKYINARLTAQADGKELLPVPAVLLDLAPLAAKHGLKHGKSGPMTHLEMRELPVGKSGIPGSGLPLLRQLFVEEGLDLQQPAATVDIDGNRYVVVKTSDEAGRVPPLADIRPEVLKAWKQQEAAKLAEKYAQGRAAKAEESKSRLAEFFAEDAGVKVVTTDPFAELTGGEISFVGGQFQPTPFRLSQPKVIEAAGPDFMKAVFELKEGGVAAVLNNDHSIAYVVRLVEHQPPHSELRSAYLAEANTWPGLTMMTQGHAEVNQQLLIGSVLKAAKLDWVRTPDRIENREEGEGD